MWLQIKLRWLSAILFPCTEARSGFTSIRFARAWLHLGLPTTNGIAVSTQPFQASVHELRDSHFLTDFTIF